MKAGQTLFLGVDVGTGSARAGLFDVLGAQVGVGVEPIQMFRPAEDFVEQSSEDIWEAVCRAVGQAMEAAGAAPEQVAGIGFDATCSLVLLDAEDRPVTVSPNDRDEQNVIVWMDHRAMEQAARINATGHDVLRYVGGVISPEMQPPKLLWLAEELPQSFARAERFLDLPDFLAYRATGDDTRSLCTTVCKWTYQGQVEPTVEGSVGRWNDSFWHEIGLGGFVDEGYSRIGRRVRPMGEPAGRGLTARAAEELGLRPGTAVSVAIIDAHAGGVGLLGAGATDVSSLNDRLALIGGTSSCHMAVAPEARFVPGVWGPYFSAMIPGLWLNEGGQSATGALVDHVIFSHARAAELEAEAQERGLTVYDLLNERLERLCEQEDLGFPAALTADLHLMPDFHGNRSPRADPTLRGMISGLRLSTSVDELALLYLATIQAVAHGTRHILAALDEQGYAIDTLVLSGGGSKNPVFVREHADITGCQVLLPREPEAVLLGAAMLGSVAAGAFESVTEAMVAMSGTGERVSPVGGDVAAYHEAKHAVFHRMYEDQLAYRALMRGN